MNNSNINVYECKAENHFVRIKLKGGKIQKCGYLMKNGSWHYARHVDRSGKEIFDTGEPKNYVETLHYVINVIFYYEREKFDILVKSISESEKEFHSYAKTRLCITSKTILESFKKDYLKFCS